MTAPNLKMLNAQICSLRLGVLQLLFRQIMTATLVQDLKTHHGCVMVHKRWHCNDVVLHEHIFDELSKQCSILGVSKNWYTALVGVICWNWTLGISSIMIFASARPPYSFQQRQ